MRKVIVAQSLVVATALGTFGYSASSSPATAATLRAPLPKVEGAVVPVNHRRYWRQDYYYPYYPYPYAPYYYGPPPIAYAPPVIYYPGPRYYPGPAVYGPRFYVGRPYGSYYADW